MSARGITSYTARTLKSAWYDAGPTPCEFFLCPMRATCAARLLACDAFALYVQRGSLCDPRTQMHPPRRAGMAVADTAPATSPPLPSAACYAQIYAAAPDVNDGVLQGLSGVGHAR